jgi:hypothetical protein
VTSGGGLDGWTLARQLLTEIAQSQDKRLTEVERLLDQIRVEIISEIRVEIASLKAKAGLWAALAAAVPAAIAALVWLLTR